jgi:hypothetical protein
MLPDLPMMKLKSRTLSIVLSLFCAAPAIAETVTVFHGLATPQHAFAAGDLRNALEARKIAVETKDLSELAETHAGRKIVIALASDARVSALLQAEGGASAESLGPQAYAIRTTQTPSRTHWVLGGDVNGAMYGALQLAENVHFKGMDEAFDEDDAPHLLNRGIKFNIPLDKEAPTYFNDSRGTANQLAIRHVWDITFWQTWFDEMARHRYNVVTLWNPHPFTSLLNMEDEYPGIAIQGVTGFDKDGNETRINDWSIDRKIAFWQEVMRHGHERGFDIHLFTWNIFLSTAEGKHGIGKGPRNKATRTYLSKSTRKLLETYPHLAGIGFTAGENMDTDDTDLKENWGWDAYGRAVFDYAKEHPDRELVFIHRLLQSDLGSMTKHFQPLIDQPNVRFSLSHKYSNAHAHAAVKPIYWTRKKLEPQLGQLGITSWLTVRNDDFFYLHWADPQFVRDYIGHFPEVGKHVDGFHIGPDGWAFSRVFHSKDPHWESTGALDVQRTWLMQKLWGRIAYNPAVSDALFRNHLAHRYPEAEPDALLEAWSKASRAVRLMNEQVTGKWSLDFHWWPERWTHKDEGFRTLRDLVQTEPMDGSDLADVRETAKGNLKGKRSALDNADDIEALAKEAQSLLASLEPGANHELALNLGDLQAMTHLSLYGAHKLRAAVSVEQDKPAEARAHLVAAIQNWMAYADLMDDRYRGAEMQRNHHFQSWHQLSPEVLRDLSDLGGPVSLDQENPYPWVRIATPLDLSEIKAPADLVLAVNAAAADGQPVKVELLLGDEVVHRSSDPAFTHTLGGMALGEHRLTARVTDSGGASKEHVIRVAVFDEQTQDSLPWVETFTLPYGSVRDDGRTTWAAERSTGVFEVRDHALFLNDKGDEAVLRTGEIDISGGPVDIGLEVTPQGGVDSGDYVRLYRVVEGGKEELIGEVKGNAEGATRIQGTATGSKLILVLRARVSASDEVFVIDNLKVTTPAKRLASK